jgi:Domain of unknown function (DUF4160)
MPEVARFYGIIIKVFFGDHPPPHFHAVYGEYNALVNIEKLEVFEGDLPNRAEKLVLEWAALYQQELLYMWNLREISRITSDCYMWNSQEFHKLPPLK